MCVACFLMKKRMMMRVIAYASLSHLYILLAYGLSFIIIPHTHLTFMKKKACSKNMQTTKSHFDSSWSSQISWNIKLFFLNYQHFKAYWTKTCSARFARFARRARANYMIIVVYRWFCSIVVKVYHGHRKENLIENPKLISKLFYL